MKRDVSSLHRLDWRAAHRLDPHEPAFPDDHRRNRSNTRTVRLSIGPLSGDRNVANANPEDVTLARQNSELWDERNVPTRFEKVASECEWFSATLSTIPLHQPLQIARDFAGENLLLPVAIGR
jgi:hypothetical protein